MRSLQQQISFLEFKINVKECKKKINDELSRFKVDVIRHKISAVEENAKVSTST